MLFRDLTSPMPALITWLDTTNYEGWFGDSDEVPMEPLKMETLGWLIKQNKSVVVVAMTASKYKFGELLVIPASCVQSITTLPPIEGAQPVAEVVS